MRRIRALPAFAALTLALALAPAAAFAVEVPSDADTFEEAEAWAQAYVEGQAASMQLLSEGDAGWELVNNADEGWELLAASPDTSWYNAGASSYTLSSGSHLMGLAKLVNEGVDFTGKTVLLAGDVAFIATEVDPIGGAGGHVFNGTFDGQGHTVRGFSITSVADTGRAENLALFGACGADSVIKNVNVPAATVTVKRSAASTQMIRHVAGIVGVTEGSIENCSSAATIDISVDTPQTAAEKHVVKYVGGVAGVVFGNVKGCSYAGTLKAVSNTAATGDADANGRSVGIDVMAYFGGVVSYLGDPAVQEKPGVVAHGLISNCSFTGKIETSTPCSAGKDRFDEPIQSQSVAVGGIVGYSQGSVDACTYAGDINAPQSQMVGGIVGSFRCMGTAGLGDISTHDFGSSTDRITCSRSASAGGKNIISLYACGGIVGAAGSYTTITECQNGAYVCGMRWNKPFLGGIAGQSSGEVSYCMNAGTVQTYTGGGYYAAGLAGMLKQYTEPDGTPTHETPECFGSINVGKVLATLNMKSAMLVAQNEGKLHDCLSLEGTCIDGAVFQVDDSSSGSLSNCQALPAEQLKTSAACGVLNLMKAATQDFDNYFVVVPGENDGYPELKYFAKSVNATTIAGAGVKASCEKDAAYTGGDAIPTLNVTFNGTKLVQNADYYVVPQQGASNIGSGYRAGIVGLGHYAGRVDNVCSYGIVKGSLADCTVSIRTQDFNYQVKKLTSEDITVTDAYGNQVPSSWYTFDWKMYTYDGNNAAYKGKTMPYRYISPSMNNNYSKLAPEWSVGGPLHYGYYPVIIKATSASNYEGQVEGLFKIKPESLVNCTIDAIEVEINGQKLTYNWGDSSAGVFTDGSPVIPYTGGKIMPRVTSVTWKDPAGGENAPVHTLVEGQDYRLIYGNPNSDTNTANYTLYNNIGTNDTNTVGCVTVRYIGGGRPYDFDNYTNMYFVIHGANAPAVSSIADCRVVAEDQAYTGKEIQPVRVYAPDGSELSQEFYRVAYENNVEKGTATYHVYGVRDYTGATSGTFQIYDAADALGYVDVNPADWYVKSGALAFAKESGLIRGVDDTHFLPYDTLTRAQAATILWRYADPEAEAAFRATMASTKNTTGMTDVEDGAWYTGAANWAVANKVINGVLHPDGTRSFDPNGTITREQICTILANYAHSQNGQDIAAATDAAKLAAMPDAAEVGAWARDSVAWALSVGVINGAEENGVRYVRPSRGVLRCEMATIMMNCTETNHIIAKPGEAPTADAGDVNADAGAKESEVR